MHGDLTAVYKFCYLIWTLSIGGGGGLKGWPGWSSAGGGGWVSGARAVADAPPGCLLWNTWLSCLLILEEKGIPSPVPLPVQASLLRGRPLRSDSHSWYTSHIQPPTRSAADTSRRGRGWGSTRTYYLIMQRFAAHMHAPSQITGMYLRLITRRMWRSHPALCGDFFPALLGVSERNSGREMSQR